jgi:O-antigen/teichoic acid export membrane protein
MKKASRNFLFLFISDGLTRVIGIVATVYIARMLAVEGFGLINYGLAFISYALLFANPGLTVIGAREVAKTPDRHLFIEETLGLRVVLAILIFVIFLCGTRLIPGNDTTKGIILIYALALFPFAVLLEFVFQGREEMGYIGAERIIQYAVYLVILLMFLKGARDIIVVPLAFVIGYIIAAAFLIVVFVKKYKSLRFRFSIPGWRVILQASVPVGLAIIFNHATISLPPIILGIFKSNYEVGIFSAGYKIVFMLLIIERVFYYVFFPILSKQYKQNPEKLVTSFNFLTRFLFALTIPLTLGGLILAGPIVELIYGSAFLDAAIVLRILLLYFMIVPINTIFGYGLIAIDQERSFSRVITITAFISAVLLIILGIRFSVCGAALALLVSESISIVLMNKVLQKTVRFGSFKYIFKPLFASLVMAAVLYMLQAWHLVVLLAIGTCLYLVVLYLIRG